MSAVANSAGSAAIEQIFTEPVTVQKDNCSQLNQSSDSSKVTKVAKESLSSCSSNSSEKIESKLNKTPVYLIYEKEVAKQQASTGMEVEYDGESNLTYDEDEEVEFIGESYITYYGEGDKGCL